MDFAVEGREATDLDSEDLDLVKVGFGGLVAVLGLGVLFFMAWGVTLIQSAYGSYLTDPSGIPSMQPWVLAGLAEGVGCFGLAGLLVYVGVQMYRK